MTQAVERTERDPWSNLAARMRFVGGCLFFLFPIGWAVWFYPFDDLLDRSGTPLGGDYTMLYVAGQTVLKGESSSLYNDRLNQERTADLFPSMDANQAWPFRYPPTVAACMTTLAVLPFGVSYFVFFLIVSTIWVVSLRTLAGHFPILKGTHRTAIVWAMLGWPVVMENLLGGQSSMLALAVVVSYMSFAARGRLVIAGAVLAVALYKPNVLALFILGCVLRHPRTLWGFIPTALIGAVVSCATVGWDGLRSYMLLGTRLATNAWDLETPFWKVHGLVPWVELAWPSHARALTMASGALLTVCLAYVWRRDHRVSTNQMLAALLTINSLFNPYVPIYDLILLLPAALLFADYVLQSKSSRAGGATNWPLDLGAWVAVVHVLVLLVFLGPHVSQMLARPLGYQLFPLGLLAILGWQLWEILRHTSWMSTVQRQAMQSLTD